MFLFFRKVDSETASEEFEYSETLTIFPDPSPVLPEQIVFYIDPCIVFPHPVYFLRILDENQGCALVDT
jgi:hypothetical protein